MQEEGTKYTYKTEVQLHEVQVSVLLSETYVVPPNWQNVCPGFEITQETTLNVHGNNVQVPLQIRAGFLQKSTAI